jgi:short-subunit dehydrogenase
MTAEKKKIALVTGGNRGIGFETWRQLLWSTLLAVYYHLILLLQLLLTDPILTF